MAAAEVDFSWTLKINGAAMENFGNMVFSHKLSGYGTSGVLIKQFEFDLYDPNGQYASAILPNVPVEVSCTFDTFYGEPFLDTIPKYYISKRTVSQNVCHFICYDKLSTSDRQFDSSELSFTDNKIALSALLPVVFAQCGITEYGFSDNSGSTLINFTKDQLENCSCRNVLEEVAAAMCGVWVCTGSDKAILSCFGHPYEHVGYVHSYAAIDNNGTQKITALSMKNTTTGEIYSYSTGEYGIGINIDSAYASEALAGCVWDRIQNYTYKAWNCSGAAVGQFIFTASKMYFYSDDKNYTEYIANDVTIHADSTGVYFSGGSAAQDEETWKYSEYLDREKISVNQNIGNMAITRNGRIVFRNLNQEA